MDFDIFDDQMRKFERSLDRIVPSGVHIVVRLDGHGFTKLTKESWDLERPFDIKFHDIMVSTVEHLIRNCNFRIVYGYTQSDEISLLLHVDDNAFGRKERKLLSILASEASVAFSIAAGRHAVFDSRIVPLPGIDDIVDYFRWRQEDALRNCLESHCYWMLRKQGDSASEAGAKIKGTPNTAKKEMLVANGIKFEELPTWQTLGTGFYFKNVTLEAADQKGNTVEYTRRRLFVDETLPYGREYGCLVEAIVDGGVR